MSANPHPDHVADFLDGNGAVMEADANRPEWPDSFKMQRGMARILAEQSVRLIGQLLNFGGQSPVGIPESRAGAMVHRSVVRPECKSSRASLVSQSKRPAATSASNWSRLGRIQFGQSMHRAVRSSGDKRRIAASISCTVLDVRTVYGARCFTANVSLGQRRTPAPTHGIVSGNRRTDCSAGMLGNGWPKMQINAPES